MLFNMSCGIDANVHGSVDVIHKLDFDSIYNFFLKYCNNDRICADKRFDEFLDFLKEEKI